jgi:hypothetical protein
MVTTKKDKTKGKVKVGKLNLNKETVKDLTGGEEKRIKGGLAARPTPKCGDFPKTADTVCNCA